MKVKVRLRMRYDYNDNPARLVVQYKTNKQFFYTDIEFISRETYGSLFLDKVIHCLNSKSINERLEYMVIEDIKIRNEQKHKKGLRKEKEEEILDKLKNIKFEFEINDKDLK